VGAVRIPVRINMGFGIRTRDTTPLMSIPALKAMGVRWVSLSRMLPAAAIHGMTQALSVMREAMMREDVIERADLVVDMKTISSLMDYDSYMAVEREFLPQDDLARRYGRSPDDKESAK
jgi:2-methylisocitrate lyase-like PEP mutase family enzyme